MYAGDDDDANNGDDTAAEDDENAVALFLHIIAFRAFPSLFLLLTIPKLKRNFLCVDSTL